VDIFDNSFDEVRAATRADVAAHPMAAYALPPGKTLRFTLQRDLPRAAEWTVDVVFGAIVATLGSAGVLWVLDNFLKTADLSYPSLLGFLFCASIGWYGYKSIGRGIYVLLGSRTPVPALEIDRGELRAGDEFRLLLIQPGPVTLDQIDVDLVGIERVVLDGKSIERNTFFRIVFSEENVRVRRGDELRREITFRVPDDVMPTARTDKELSMWRIVVESDVRFGANCTHQFPVLMQPLQASRLDHAPEQAHLGGVVSGRQ
jgi:hypothetical protein